MREPLLFFAIVIQYFRTASANRQRLGTGCGFIDNLQRWCQPGSSAPNQHATKTDTVEIDSDTSSKNAKRQHIGHAAHLHGFAAQ